MSRNRRGLALLVTVALVLAGCSADPKPREPRSVPTPGATPTVPPGPAGVGDPYFPTAGNGGYDVERYTLKVRYDPANDELRGTATVRATATADLSPFNLDLAGLTVRRVTVDGSPARHAREGDELVVTPARRPDRGQRRSPSRSRYDGVPKPLQQRGARRAAASCTPPTGRSRSASPSRRAPGSRSTTTRPTRRPTTSRSPCRTG